MTLTRIIPFMAARHITALLSLLLVALSLATLWHNGLNFGLDFTGGTQMELRFAHAPELSTVRQSLEALGMDAPTVVQFGSERDILVRTRTALGSEQAEAILSALAVEAGPAEMQRLDFVGPQVGEELRDDGGLGLLAALLLVMAFVTVRFHYKFAVGAILALIHDVILTLGFFSILKLEVDLTVLAAVLAVIGYSINDTIVMFDRVRENFRAMRDADTIGILDASMTQVLQRTIMTSVTTLLVLLALLLVGGDVIRNFAVALIVGISVGTYSSLYVAANTTVALKLTRQDLVRPASTEEDEANLPP